jgi:DNA modification methylase
MPDGSLIPFTQANAPVQPFKIPDSVIRTSQVTGPRDYGDHPAPFPLALPVTFIQAYPGDLWLDPFAGSGTTLIAAHRLGRRAVLIEIEPKYCDVILRRAEAEGLTVERAE